MLAASLRQNVLACLSSRCKPFLSQQPSRIRASCLLKTAAMAGETSSSKKFQAGNESYASGFKNADLPSPPGLKTAIITCMDCRLHPESFLGLKEGDSHMIRNAGGVFDEGALRSLVISQRLLGTKEVYVIQHTGCGMESFENEDLYKKVETDLGPDAGSEASKLNFRPFKGLEKSVRDNVKAIQDSKLLAKVPVHGFIYDVKSGKIDRVV